MGAVLASALRQVGHEIRAVSGASPDTLERIDALLPGVEVRDALEVARGADLVLVTVPDDDIAAVTGWLAAQGAFHPGQLVVHASGRHGVEVLRPALDAGAIGLAIHPAMTFSGTSIDLSRLVGAPFAVTAPAPVLPIGQALVVELGGEPVLLPEAARGAYHAALSHASNHLVTLVAQARDVLAAAGVDDGARLLGPLTRASLEGALGEGAAALTGPVSRGDTGTVAVHLAALGAVADVSDTADGVPDPALDAAEVSLAYRALARATAHLAHREGRIDAATRADLVRLVREHPGGGDTAPTAPSGSGPVGTRTRLDPVRTVAALRAARARLTGDVAVVMTMGALHEGHLSLVRAARTAARHVIVTIFVNPTQFGDAGDLAAYPRTLEADLDALATLGPDAPDVVFAPSASEIYPDGTAAPGARVVAGPAAHGYEGASRPGHFDGVLTVVTKLLHLTRPDVAVFGAKDAQQLAVVRAMVRALDLPLWVLAAPVVRDDDGLARSSRNVRLGPGGRRAALALPRSVAVVERLAAAGAGVADVERAARAELEGADGVALDYADLVDPDTFAPLAADAPTGADGPREATYVVAAVVDGVRLLDTTTVTLHPREA
ncbi:hypothetical protein GCM10025875_24340 [Litorihabitans aurantiacus]|uniref:Pantothenate synthetase n=1 Tax=Litorihabitans aurantiacus TaxID=1930061 RepID=A0AA38CVI5_9MICO|nr:hypothetical protein GCM10025875_24340 [Litorihabitans aurantiacus]